MTAVDIPDSDVARFAHDVLHSTCEPFLAAHCERSYRFAELLAAADAVDVDHELLYVGVLLHDLGLSSRHQGSERFEVRGANAAREMLGDHGWPPERVETVWDIIALHTSREIARHKTAETNYANQGISIDVRGAAPSTLGASDVRSVLDDWPRTSFPAAMSDALISEVRSHPGTTRSTWMEHIAAAEIEGYERLDFIAALRASTAFI